MGSRFKSWRLALVLVVAGLSLPGRGTRGASAGSGARGSGRTALAEALFEEGKQLFAAGKTAEACAKLAESNRIEAANGTLLNLAVCNETLGNIATASAQFQEAEAAARSAGRTDRATLARQHLASLTPRLSWLTVVVHDFPRPAGFEITLDGAVLGEGAWNLPFPIDPGPHSLVVRARDRSARTYPLLVGPTAGIFAIGVEPPPVGTPEARPALVAPGPRGAAPARASGGAESPGATPSPAPGPPGAAEAEPAPADTRRPTLAYVTGGLGAAALVVGGVFGQRAFSKWAERNRECSMNVCGTPAGREAQDAAESAAVTADVLVGAGVVALAASAYLFYRAVHGPDRSPVSGAHPEEGGRHARLDPFVAPVSNGLVIGARF